MENNELIEELYKKYYKYLLYIAKQNVSKTYADDIVQNVFLNLMKSPYWLAQCSLKSNNPEELKNILRTFLNNSCKNYYKHSNKKHDIFQDISNDELFTIPIDVEQKYCNTDLLERIINIISKLKGRGKDIIMKYYIEGYSIDELAEQTGLSTRTIENYLYRTLNFLRKKIKE
jgi:RNA polymerase sigma-70 factor (ECF subfamily)